MHVIRNHGIRKFRNDHRLETIMREVLAAYDAREGRNDGPFGHAALNNDLIRGNSESEAIGFLWSANMMSPSPGAFGAGDVRADHIKQAAFASGEGASASSATRPFLGSFVQVAVMRKDCPGRLERLLNRGCHGVPATIFPAGTVPAEPSGDDLREQSRQ